MVRAIPLVSLVVPCFNEQPDVLARSLDSVKCQSFSDFECLVVDESTCELSARTCKAICEAHPHFQYIRPKSRLGLAGSLNVGIGAARGQYIARFDSDDICMPQRLEQQLLFLNAHPEIGVVGGQLAIVDKNETFIALRRYPLDHDAIERRFHLNSAMAHPTVMLRRSILDMHGAYSPAFKYAEDLDLWLRLLKNKVRFANLDSILVRYRQQSTRRSSDHWRYNLLARLKNFHSRQMVSRAAGMLTIGMWATLPKSVQEQLFAKLILDDGKAEGDHL